MHLHGVLSDMGIEQTLPLVLNVDNQAAIALSRNPVQHGKTKHFSIKLHFIRDLCTQQFLVLKYLSTDNMPADIMTKCLGKLKTAVFGNFIMGISDAS